MKPFKFSKKNREYTKWGKNVKEVRVFPKGKDGAAPAPVPEFPAGADGEAAPGRYSNLAVITHTDAEFLTDFIFAPPGQAWAAVNTRIVLAPVMAKALAAAIGDNLRRYEQRFGQVKA